MKLDKPVESSLLCNDAYLDAYCFMFWITIALKCCAFLPCDRHNQNIPLTFWISHKINKRWLAYFNFFCLIYFWKGNKTTIALLYTTFRAVRLDGSWQNTETWNLVGMLFFFITDGTKASLCPDVERIYVLLWEPWATGIHKHNTINWTSFEVQYWHNQNKKYS